MRFLNLEVDLLDQLVHTTAVVVDQHWVSQVADGIHEDAEVSKEPSLRKQASPLNQNVRKSPLQDRTLELVLVDEVQHEADVESLVCWHFQVLLNFAYDSREAEHGVLTQFILNLNLPIQILWQQLLIDKLVAGRVEVGKQFLHYLVCQGIDSSA